MLPIVMRAEKARLSAAVFLNDRLTVVEFKGADTFDFLNRMGTAKVKGRSVDSVFQTLFLRGDGRMQGEAILRVVASDRVIGLVDSSIVDELTEALDRFLFTEDVKITQLKNRKVFVLFGARALEIANAVMGTAVSAWGTAQTGELGSVLATEICPESHYVFLAMVDENVAQVRAALWANVEAKDGVIGEAKLFEVLRVENGIPKFGAELSDKTIPLEAGLKGAIDFAKGCFPGQEIVARIENLGHPANVLAGIQLAVSDHTLEGAELESVDGKKLGPVTSATFSPILGQTLALGYVKWDFREAGTGVKVRFADGSLGDGTVVALPLR